MAYNSVFYIKTNEKDISAKYYSDCVSHSHHRPLDRLPYTLGLAGHSLLGFILVSTATIRVLLHTQLCWLRWHALWTSNALHFITDRIVGIARW